MTLFRAYFDESGIHEGAAYTFVAGFVGKQSSWLSISQQWQKVLKKFGVKTFHANDFYNCWGEFKNNWDDVEKKHDFTNKLFKVIESEKGLKSIGIGVKRTLFHEISAQYPTVPLTPYTLCAEYCGIYTGGIALRKKHWPPVAITFANLEKHLSPVFNHLYLLQDSHEFQKKHKINSIDWKDVKGVPPLQMADMFAYELFKLHEAKLKYGKNFKVRYT
ncbi:MAG: DUF3800 domain-containing protein, partial [Candidatus Zixiibacteriota bacterium]